MQEVMILAIGALAVVALCLLGFLVHERERAAVERRGWAQERARLLDRIMAVDYTRFCIYRPDQEMPEAEAEEAYDPLEDDTIAGTVQHIVAESD